MEKYYLAKTGDTPQAYNDSEFAMSELLTSTHEEGIRDYKCLLKAGCEVPSDLCKEDTVLLIFGKGTGCAYSKSNTHNILKLSSYVPDFDKEPYTIHTTQDMELISSTAEVNQWDRELLETGRVHLSFLLQVNNVVKYNQGCKGPHTTSWHTLSLKMLGRIMVEVVRAEGEGTTEKGHSKVHQRNYCVDSSGFSLTVDNCPAVNHKTGDWSFIPARPDHALTVGPGKEVYYVWYEHYTREKDFYIALVRGEEFNGKY